VDAGNLLLYVHAPERIELLGVGLELCEVFVLRLLLLVGLECLEDDDPAGLVAEAEEFAGVIEFYYRDYILLHYFLVRALIPENLREFVAASLAGLIFLHAIFFYSIINSICLI
jgi:hypothetical protein